MHKRWDVGPLLPYGILLERVGQTMAQILVPLWAVQLHAPVPVIGIDVAAVSLAPVFFSIPLGAISDRLGPRRLILAGSFVLALTCLLSAIPNYWLLGVWQLLSGLGRTAAWIGAQTMIAGSAGAAERTRRLGLLGLSVQVGAFLGPLLAGVLYASRGAQASFAVAAAVVGLFVLVGLFLPGQAAVAAPARGHVEGARTNDFARALRLLAEPGIRLMVSGTGVRLILMALKGSFYVVLLHDAGFGSPEIGLVFALCSGVAALAAPLTGAVERRLTNLGTLVMSMGVMAVALTATPFLQGLVAQLVLMGLFGWGQGQSQPALISLGASSTEAGSVGLAIGLRTTVNRVVQVVTPALFGVLAVWLAMPVLFAAFGTVSAGALAYTAFNARPAAAGRSAEPPASRGQSTG